MSDYLSGTLIWSDFFGNQIQYTFGQNQVKNIPIHSKSIDFILNNCMEGEEIPFIIRGCANPHSLNGNVSSAFVLEDVFLNKSK